MSAKFPKGGGGRVSLAGPVTIIKGTIALLTAAEPAPKGQLCPIVVSDGVILPQLPPK